MIKRKTDKIDSGEVKNSFALIVLPLLVLAYVLTI